MRPVSRMIRRTESVTRLDMQQYNSATSSPAAESTRCFRGVRHLSSMSRSLLSCRAQCSLASKAQGATRSKQFLQKPQIGNTVSYLDLHYQSRRMLCCRPARQLRKMAEVWNLLRAISSRFELRLPTVRAGWPYREMALQHVLAWRRALLLALYSASLESACRKL